LTSLGSHISKLVCDSSRGTIDSNLYTPAIGLAYIHIHTNGFSFCARGYRRPLFKERVALFSVRSMFSATPAAQSVIQHEPLEPNRRGRTQLVA